MPGQFIEGTSLDVGLPRDDGLMFLQGDGAFFPVADIRPLALRDDRHGQPVHAESEVVNTPEKRIGGHTPKFQGTQEMFRASFEHGEITDAIEGLLLDRHQPSGLRDSVLDLTISSITNCQVRVAAWGSPTRR